MLKLDGMLAFNLLIASKNMTKGDLACREAKRTKKLVGSLRHLYRNSNSSEYFLQLLQSVTKYRK